MSVEEPVGMPAEAMLAKVFVAEESRILGGLFATTFWP
jgi:hypothetical protein